jgi:hypothetical protein
MNGEQISWRAAATKAVRRLAIVLLAGAVSGLVVGGFGGRLAMFLLAQLNPEAAGVRSDDDFVIGQFTVIGTLNLLAVATVLGIIGGAVYLVVRGLRLGPAWFRYASVAAGAGAVVGSAIAQDGVDFTLLKPGGLAIALFVAIPALYAVMTQWLAERWLDSDSTLMTTRNRLVFLPALAAVPLFPLALGLGAGWFASESVRRSSSSSAARIAQVVPWIGRLVLAAIFALAVSDLVKDIEKFA